MMAVVVTLSARVATSFSCAPPAAVMYSFRAVTPAGPIAIAATAICRQIAVLTVTGCGPDDASGPAVS